MNKEPWLAVNLSRLLPGIGQVYVGQTLKGYIILASYFLFMGIGISQFLSSSGNPIVGLSLLSLTIIILPIWNLFDAYYSARLKNSLAFESTRQKDKDVWLAIFLSSFIPGLGHLYLRYWLPGMIFLTSFLLTVGLSASDNQSIVILGGILQVILILFSFYHVYNYSNQERSRQHINQFIISFISIYIFTVFFAGLMRQFVIETRYIPAESMLPTLKVNDRLVINKLIYRFYSPQRGDVVVFNPTKALEDQNYQDAFIKRVIGLPGDRVEVRGGQVIINGTVLRENYIQERPQYQLDPVVVPPDQYMVLGDNRNNSYDSHYWGFVPKDKIIGRAVIRFWPFDRLGGIKPDETTKELPPLPTPTTSPEPTGPDSGAKTDQPIPERSPDVKLPEASPTP